MKRYTHTLLSGVCGAVLALTACSTFPNSETSAISVTSAAPSTQIAETKEQSPKALQLVQVDMPALPVATDFKLAFLKSCDRILKKTPSASYGPTSLGGTAKDWHPPCRDAIATSNNVLLEQYFNAYQVYGDYDKTGLFTGYYEPLLFGSRTKSERYSTPLYAYPDDLLEINLSDFSDEFQDRKIRGKIEGKSFKPYADRAEIENGALDKKGEVIVYVDNAIDAFFLHIQGSGIVKLEDGTKMRVGYAGQNGHSYFAIGRDLVARGALDKKDVSLQTIRQWMIDNPDEAVTLMHKNPSYIFFRELKGNGSLGAQGVELTAETSLAIDDEFYPYGMPALVRAEAPVQDDVSSAPIHMLMVAQDTGGAITNPVRGDIFWGSGETARHNAGHMKSRGEMIIFLPKTIEISGEYLRDAAQIATASQNLKSTTIENSDTAQEQPSGSSEPFNILQSLRNLFSRSF